MTGSSLGKAAIFGRIAEVTRGGVELDEPGERRRRWECDVVQCVDPSMKELRKT